MCCRPRLSVRPSEGKSVLCLPVPSSSRSIRTFDERSVGLLVIVSLFLEVQGHCEKTGFSVTSLPSSLRLGDTTSSEANASSKTPTVKNLEQSQFNDASLSGYDD